MFSVIIPSLNNLKYLKLCIESIRKNSKYDHEIIVHSNIGSDGTIDYLKKNNIRFTHSKKNSGIPEGVNIAAKKASKNYIVYAHDDFYFFPGWDTAFFKEINKMTNNLYYFSGTIVQNGQVNLDCGSSIETFDEQKALMEYKNIDYYDFQGSTWAPHIIHKDTWNKVGGFSEEYYPGTGSDPDLNMKLWREGIRIFKGLSKCKVYHFGSIVTRKYKNHPTIKTESGSKGGKIFLLKWGITFKFFKKHYLRSDSIYEGELSNPKRNIQFYLELIICKLNYIYLKIFNPKLYK